MKDEVLLKTSDALVRILRLDPGGATPWHWHTEVDDQMVCLEGHVSLEMSDPDEAVELHAGQLVKVGHRRRHRVTAHFADGERLFRSIVIGRFGDRERSGATPVSLWL